MRGARDENGESIPECTTTGENLPEWPDSNENAAWQTLYNKMRLLFGTFEVKTDEDGDGQGHHTIFAYWEGVAKACTAPRPAQLDAKLSEPDRERLCTCFKKQKVKSVPIRERENMEAVLKTAVHRGELTTCSQWEASVDPEELAGLAVALASEPDPGTASLSGGAPAEAIKATPVFMLSVQDSRLVRYGYLSAGSSAHAMAIVCLGDKGGSVLVKDSGAYVVTKWNSSHANAA